MFNDSFGKCWGHAYQRDFKNSRVSKIIFAFYAPLGAENVKIKKKKINGEATINLKQYVYEDINGYYVNKIEINL